MKVHTKLQTFIYLFIYVMFFPLSQQLQASNQVGSSQNNWLETYGTEITKLLETKGLKEAYDKFEKDHGKESTLQPDEKKALENFYKQNQPFFDTVGGRVNNIHRTPHMIRSIEDAFKARFATLIPNSESQSIPTPQGPKPISVNKFLVNEQTLPNTFRVSLGEGKNKKWFIFKKQLSDNSRTPSYFADDYEWHLTIPLNSKPKGSVPWSLHLTSHSSDSRGTRYYYKITGNISSITPEQAVPKNLQNNFNKIIRAFIGAL